MGKYLTRADEKSAENRGIRLYCVTDAIDFSELLGFNFMSTRLTLKMAFYPVIRSCGSSMLKEPRGDGLITDN